jgi:hypothetical protein
LESLIDDEAEEVDGNSEEEGKSLIYYIIYFPKFVETTIHSERDGDGSSFIDDSVPLKVSKKRKMTKEKTNSMEMNVETKKEEFKPPQFSLDSQYQSFASEESQRKDGRSSSLLNSNAYEYFIISTTTTILLHLAPIYRDHPSHCLSR